MPVEYDFSDLKKLTADVGEAIAESTPGLRAAVQVNAQHVKDDWNKSLSEVGGHAKLTGRAITYDTEEKANSIEADIGAVRGSGRQAGVVRLLENGSIKNPARGLGTAALHKNEDDLERGIEIALDQALKKAGL